MKFFASLGIASILAVAGAATLDRHGAVADLHGAGAPGPAPMAQKIRVGRWVVVPSDENEMKSCFEAAPLYLGMHLLWHDAMRTILGTTQEVVEVKTDGDVIGIKESFPNSGQPVWYYPDGCFSKVQAEGKCEKHLCGMTIKFEVKNLNYYDLTKKVCPLPLPAAKKVLKSPTPAAKAAPDEERPPGPSVDPLEQTIKDMDDMKLPAAPGVPDPNVTKGMGDVHEVSEDITDGVTKALEPFGERPKGSGLPWMKKKQSLLQASSNEKKGCTTFQDVLTENIKKTVKRVLDRMFEESLFVAPAPAPGPAPMPAVVPAGLVAPSPAFLQTRHASPEPAPAPAPSPGPSMPPKPKVSIFVYYSPGSEPGSEYRASRSTIVHITFVDRVENGLDDLMLATPLLQTAIRNGVLMKTVKKSMTKVVGFKPKLGKVALKKEDVIEEWPVRKCKDHMKGIVNTLSYHYTRNQVPIALYNECTNFLPKMSFSHDHVLDPLDTVRCRKATAKFERLWNYGKNAEDKDFESMCVVACEGKYGRNAPQCNVHHGDALIKQPAFL